MSKKEGTIKQKSLWQEIWKNKAIYLIMLPGIVWFIIFAYGPMSGLQLAFKTYSMKAGILGALGADWRISNMCSETPLF